MRTLLRPTGFVDSPFGHDGKVARLAGGLNWFAALELIRIEGTRRVATELVPVEGIEARFDDQQASEWWAAHRERPKTQRSLQPVENPSVSETVVGIDFRVRREA